MAKKQIGKENLSRPIVYCAQHYFSCMLTSCINMNWHTFLHLCVTHIVQMVVHVFPLDHASALQAGLMVAVQKVRTFCMSQCICGARNYLNCWQHVFIAL